MVTANTLQQLKQNTAEFAFRMNALFSEFQNNNNLSEEYSLLLMTDEEMMQDNIDKNLGIYSESGEVYTVLVNHSGTVEDLSE